MQAPSTSAEFDRVYSAPLTPWGDVRIPSQLEQLATLGQPKRVLELGCGVGRFSRYMAQVGLHTLGVDFSPIAIAKARARVAHDALKPSFQVGDVTALSLAETFDISFDVGCFHCLGDAQQLAYVAQLSQLLLAGGTHLIWALDRAPSGQRLSGEAIERVFAPAFTLASAEKNRRRLVASHWYWLRRQ